MKPRLLHLTRDFPPPSTGGLSVAVSALTRHLEAFEHRILSFDGWRPKSSERWFLSSSSSLLRRVTRAEGSNGMVFERQSLAAFVEESDMIMIHDPLLPVEGPSRPTAYVLHVLHAAQNKIRGVASTMSSEAEARWVGKGALLVAPSALAAENAANIYPRQASKIVALPLAPECVDVAAPAPRNVEKTILYVGRLDTMKGLDALLEAWASVEAALPQYRLCVIGGMPHDPKVEARWTRRWGQDYPSLQGRVSWLGWVEREETLRLIRRATLVVAPSRFETFGFAVAEAVAAGTPVLSTKVGIAAELEGLAGVHLLEAPKTELIASAIRALLAQGRGDGTPGAAYPRSLRWETLGPRWEAALLALL